MQLLQRFMIHRSDVKKNAVGFGFSVEGCYRIPRISMAGMLGGDLEN